MMRDDGIERVLDQWFAEGPTQMPTRFFNETFERIDRAPRRGVSLGIPRISVSSRKVVLAAAAVVVATVGVGGIFLTGNQGIGVVPSPSPVATTSPSTAVTPSPFVRLESAPAALEGVWVPSGARAPGADYPSSITFFPTDFEVHESIYGRYVSTWSFSPPNGLELSLQSRIGCPIGDGGSYTFSLSPEGTLTLVPQGDSCLMRTANLGGGWVRYVAKSVPLPTGLQSSWTSDVMRPVPGGCCPARYDIVIGASTITIPGVKGDLVNSVSYVESEDFDIEAIASEGDPASHGAQDPPAIWDCPAGGGGRYSFSLAPGGQGLTLTPLGDTCTARAAILAGDWVRTHMGALTDGQHLSALFTPFAATGGHFGYAVPAGWSDGYECATCMTLVAPDSVSTINVYANVLPRTLDLSRGCGVADIQRTPSAIAAWLAALPNLLARTPVPVTIGDLGGVMVDVGVGPGPDTAGCPFVHTGGGNVTLGDPDSPDRAVSVPDGGRSRLIMLDRGDGGVLLIELTARDKMAWNEVTAQAMPIIESFEFGR